MKKNNYFISVVEAKNSIRSVVKNKETAIINVENATSFILAESITSLYHSPPFNQSAMDGYAFRFADLQNGIPLKVIGEVSAGKQFKKKLASGNVIRIFTGAEVPYGTDTVVMQEKVVLENGIITIDDAFLNKGSNIRLKGSQLRKGALAVSKGTLLNPGVIGFLASLGMAQIKVYKKPKISIVVTGDELVKAGKPLLAGRIFESNSQTLIAVLKQDNICDIKVYYVKDNLQSTLKIFQRALAESDFVLFTGGISVGDYDFVGKVMNIEKVKTIFYKVKQKPGKPIYFGKKNNAFIFGLPGNPASVLTCYYEYVRTAIRKFQNYTNTDPVELVLPLKTSINKKTGLTHFLKAKTDFKSVTLLEGQESYKMKSFTEANCFIVLDENSDSKKIEELVKVHLF